MSINILLIGGGRLAKHLQKALNPVGLQQPEDQGPKSQTSLASVRQGTAQAAPSFQLHTWQRSQKGSHLDKPIADLLARADLVLLAISDSAIETFYQTHKAQAPKAQWIHFSGAQNIEGILDLHPLMTFGPELYPSEFYRSIPYVSASTTKWPMDFSLSDRLFHIKAEDKAKYHALCVLGGNFSNLLWRKAIRGFEELGLPSDVAWPFAVQTLINVFANPDKALTGPLVRKDLLTQENNLRALGEDPYADIYRAFQKAFAKEQDQKTEKDKEQQ